MVGARVVLFGNKTFSIYILESGAKKKPIHLLEIKVTNLNLRTIIVLVNEIPA
jgi:hypothetical protein